MDEGTIGGDVVEHRSAEAPRRRGRPATGRSASFSLVLPGETLKRLKARADGEGNSIATIMRRILSDAVKNDPAPLSGEAA